MASLQKVLRKSILSSFCIFTILTSSHGIAQSDFVNKAIQLDDAHLFLRQKNLKAKKKNKIKLTFNSLVQINEANGNPIDVTVTPFVALPNGKIKFGAPSNFQGTSINEVLEQIPLVSAIEGIYVVGVSISTGTSESTTLDVSLSSTIANSLNNNQKAIDQNVRNLIITSSREGQVTINFVYTRTT